jgi:hypothetical protein
MVHGIYYLDIRRNNYEVAHLFEHLVLRGFHDLLEASGYEKYLPNLFGWVSGDTYRNFVFIRFLFYDKEVERLFHAFMGQVFKIDERAMDDEVARIEAELKCEVKMDRVAVLAELCDLAEMGFRLADEQSLSVGKEYGRRQLRKRIWQPTPARGKHENVTVRFRLTRWSAEEAAILLRLAPFALDLAGNYLRYKYRAYESDYESPRTVWIGEDKGNIQFLAFQTIEKGLCSKEGISEELREIFKRFDFEAHFDKMQRSVESYASASRYFDDAIGYYEDTGCFTTWDKVEELWTKEKVRTVWRKIIITVH